MAMELLVTFLLFTTVAFPLSWLASTSQAASVSTDQLALLSFKKFVSDDPNGVLKSWGRAASNVSYCQWHGLKCGSRGRRRGRVTALELPGLNIYGIISPALANITFLRSLDLSQNHLRGSLPHEFSLLQNVNHFDLSFNTLDGEIPPSLSRCSNLRNISLGFNNLQGGIPEELGILVDLQSLSLLYNNLTGSIPADSFQKLQKLEYLSLASNKLSGVIPDSFGNLSSLTYLLLNNNSFTGTIPPSLSVLSSLTKLGLMGNYLTENIPPSLGNLSNLLWLDIGFNNLTGTIPRSLGNLYSLNLLAVSENKLTGPIPPQLGNLQNLTYLSLEFNNLTGHIPDSLFNLSSLQLFSLQSNNLQGSLPKEMGNSFPQLEYLHLGINEFHGSIPSSLCNSTNLRDLLLEYNQFSGTIPPCLGQLYGLFRLGLVVNQLEARSPTDWNFLTSLANCSILSYLGLAANNLGGTMPSSIVNLSTTLQVLYIDYNIIEGTIPEEIGNLVSLTQIAMGGNLLHGTLPVSVGRLNMLQDIEFEQNKLEGAIPASFVNLTQLTQLRLAENLLTGNIPPSLANCPLNWLDLQGNKLTGPVPIEILRMPTLSNFLDMQDNMLSGALPSEVGNLINLQQLDISNNRISGEIPKSLSECLLLAYLNLSKNLFEGSIPPSLSNLRGLQMIDLSYNNLSGNIPEFLGNISGVYLNLSFNDLEGAVPKHGIFQNLSAFSITGNSRLCGGISELRLPPCPNKVSQKHHSQKLKLIIAPIAAILCCIILLSLLALRFSRCRSTRQSQFSVALMDKYPRISYSELARGTEGFSHTNLVGVGSFGSVYKGVIHYDGKATSVAIKVINLQQHGASQSFIAECQALGHVRHRNLVKILTVCSGLDSAGNDFKALIYEFIPNGNLDGWLHNPSRRDGIKTTLDINQRLGIAIVVASALDYLHNHKPTPIVHCDLKPSNVLLDYDLVAHVADFGLAKFLRDDANSSQNSTSMGALKGTIGYIAPEYGIGNEVSIQRDIFSYGILLLELFTAKRPTDDAFMEGYSLHQYVEMALGHKTTEIIDQSLFLTEHSGAFKSDITNKEETYIACITSVLTIGIQCSKAETTERMQIAHVLRELHRLRENVNQ
ncbi:hypothetical protein C2845_PM12G06750 [Panicum miliaceum]|uniref:Receptor kinase-like protein Xa21 n=1 Tax=Panicum miliaceum TaxID=4540 RepID=A0A3L6QG19_PANMI|nr:hypothetical protein C2845_PM12G06750 [Panicum miliaceum]